ncbi:unnamed protein product [Amaranthus hypochondriacus]
MDLIMLSFHYIQNGLLFKKPSLNSNNQKFSTQKFLDTLKESLSFTLIHFYPLAGQFVTKIDSNKHQSIIYIDCKKGPGAKFIYAKASGLELDDILLSNDVHPLIRSFFDHDKAVNHDGHFRSLLSIQVTELDDGIFIGCSINHAVLDGTSYWNFWNVWSNIHKNLSASASSSSSSSSSSYSVYFTHNLPVHDRWFPDGKIISLPFKHPNEFIDRYESPPHREKIFHFSSKCIANLKKKANYHQPNESRPRQGPNEISSFQALCALIWRAMVRANKLDVNEVTYCSLLTNNRHRLNPPLNPYYFGTCISAVTASTEVGELLEHDLGWVANLVHESVVNHTNESVHDFYKEWMKDSFVYKHATLYDVNSITFENSPRFDMYGNEFGVGKPVAVRNGGGNKSVGVVNAFPGCEGNGSVDLEICLPFDSMSVFESDQELIAALLMP